MVKEGSWLQTSTQAMGLAKLLTALSIWTIRQRHASLGGIKVHTYTSILQEYLIWKSPCRLTEIGNPL